MFHYSNNTNFCRSFKRFECFRPCQAEEYTQVGANQTFSDILNSPCITQGPNVTGWEWEANPSYSRSALLTMITAWRFFGTPVRCVYNLAAELVLLPARLVTDIESNPGEHVTAAYHEFASIFSDILATGSGLVRNKLALYNFSVACLVKFFRYVQIKDKDYRELAGRVVVALGTVAVMFSGYFFFNKVLKISLVQHLPAMSDYFMSRVVAFIYTATGFALWFLACGISATMKDAYDSIAQPLETARMDGDLGVTLRAVYGLVGHDGKRLANYTIEQVMQSFEDNCTELLELIRENDLFDGIDSDQEVMEVDELCVFKPVHKQAVVSLVAKIRACLVLESLAMADREFPVGNRGSVHFDDLPQAFQDARPQRSVGGSFWDLEIDKKQMKPWLLENVVDLDELPDEAIFLKKKGREFLARLNGERTSFWALLEVDKDASEKEIRKAILLLQAALHPDKYNTAEASQQAVAENLSKLAGSFSDVFFGKQQQTEHFSEAGGERKEAS